MTGPSSRQNPETRGYLHFDANGTPIYLNSSADIANVPHARLDRGLGGSSSAYGSSNSRIDWDSTGDARRMNDRRSDDSCDTNDKRTMDSGRVDADRRPTAYGSADRSTTNRPAMDGMNRGTSTSPARPTQQRPMSNGRTFNALDPYTAQPVNTSITSNHAGAVIGFASVDTKQRFESLGGHAKDAMLNNIRATE